MLQHLQRLIQFWVAVVADTSEVDTTSQVLLSVGVIAVVVVVVVVAVDIQLRRTRRNG